MNCLDLKQVVAKTSASPSHIYALMAKGKFPRPIKISVQKVAWIDTEIDAWIAEKLATRDAKGAV